MATSALASAFVNIVPGTVELERYLKGELGTQAEAAGRLAGTKLTSGLNSSLKGMGSALTGVGTKMSLAITAPLALIGAQAIKSSAEFGVTMASMQVNAEATGVEMESLRKLAIKMGQDTVFSAGESAQAMLELSKGGMSVAAIQGGALAAAMNLAATEGMGLADASSIVIQAMNQFKIPAEQAGMAVDVLAAGAVASTASIYDLAGGLKYVGTTAATLGFDINTTVTALAALNNAGIDATTAGTSLNQFMLRLVPNTRKAAKEAAELGLNFVDAKGNMLPMVDIIKQLQDEYSNMGDAARTASLKTIFGVEGMRAANILIEQGVPGWEQLAGAVNKTGIASDLANARMSGLAGSIEMMKGSIDTALLAVGDRLDPAIRTLTGNITNLVNWFAALDPATQGVIVNFMSVLAVAGPLLIVVGKLFTATSAIITGMQILAATKLGAWFLEMSGGFITLIADMGRYVAMQAVVAATWVKDTALKIANVTATLAVEAAMKLAAAGQWLLNVAMSANPISLVIIALAALTAGLIWFFTQTKLGQEIWKGFVGFIQDSMKNISSWWSTTWTALSDGFKGTMNSVSKWFEGFVNFFVDGINTVIKTINSLADKDPTGLLPHLSIVKKVKFQAFAEGGFVTGPTNALIGEAGPEVVVPLNKFEKMMGLDSNGNGKTVNYYAAPNQSLDSEQQLLQAMKRAKVVAGW